jgi:hypothetical protein
MMVQLRINVLRRLIDEAKKKKKKRDPALGAGYVQATADNLELNTDNDGVIDPIDKENVKRYFKAMGLIP